MNPICIRHIQCLFIGRKAKPIWSAKAVGNHSDFSRGGIEAVDLARQLRLWTKTLFEAIDRIGEPEGTIRMHHDIIETAKSPPVIRGEQCLCRIWRASFHQRQLRRSFHGALIAEEHATVVIETAIAHGDIGRELFVMPCAVARIVSCHFADLDRLAGRCTR